MHDFHTRMFSGNKPVSMWLTVKNIPPAVGYATYYAVIFFRFYEMVRCY